MSPSPQRDRRYELTLPIAATPDEVWAAIATREGLERWFATGADVTPGEGGAVEWRWGDLYRWPQRIERWEPGRRLLTRYDSPVLDEAGQPVPLHIDLVLESARGGTVLHIVHSGFGPDASFDQEYDGISRGWPIELRSLKLYLERHRGRDRRLAWCTAVVEGSHDDAWRRLTGPDGLACGPEVEGLAPGARFAFTTPDGDAFEGRALHCMQHELSGEVDGRGGGFLRLSVENCGGTSQAWVWYASYSESAEDVAALEARFDARLRALFPEREVTRAGTGSAAR